MKPGEVLDRNLALLLKRAWRPVLPRESFRLQLARDVLARVPATPAPLGRPRLLWGPLAARVVAAAALIVALIAASMLWEGFAPAQPDGLLASGKVALREPAGVGAWRAVESGSVALGTLELELLTPATASARLELLHGAALDVGPAAELVAAPEAPHAARVRLLAGSLRAQAQGEPRLLLETSEGALWLERGALELAYVRVESAREVLVHLTRGSLEVAAERFEAPVELRLRAGVVRRADKPVASSEGPTRAAVPAPGAAAAEERAQEPAVAQAAISGSVHLPAEDGGEPRPAQSFEVFLLRQVTLPQVAETREHRFEDAAGQFALEGVEPGLYRLFVRAPGHATWRRDDLRVGEAPLRLDIELVRGATLAGVAVDGETGAPLEGVLVLSENDTPLQVLALEGEDVPTWIRGVRTDAQGRFRLEHVAPGTHFVRGSGGGRSVGWERAREVRDGELREGLRIALAGAGAIEGRVEDARGEPAAGVVLVASVMDFDAGRPVLTYQRDVTDAEGAYRIEGLPPGMLTLLRFGAQHDPREQTLDMVFVQVRGGATSRQDFLARRTGLQLSGRVLGSDGTPLPGRLLWLAPRGAYGEGDELAWVSTTADAQGAYKFEGLDAGAFDLYLGGRAPPDMGWVSQVEVAPGGPTLHDVLAPASGLGGHVRDAAGAPVPYAVLVLWRQEGEPRFIGKYFTDERGAYQIAFLQPGAYALEVHPTRPGLAFERVDWLTLAAGEVLASHDLVLGPGGGAHLQVVDDRGEPVPGAALRFRSPEGRLMQLGRGTSADPEGRYLAVGMTPGPWTLSVSAPGFREHEQALEVRAGTPSEVRVVLERAP